MTRLAVIQAGVAVVFASLALAFWYLQVVQHVHFNELAENNHQRLLSLRAPRGVLYDRDGKVLVENRDSMNISVVCRQTTSLYPFRECDRIKRNTHGRRRLPSDPCTHAP